MADRVVKFRLLGVISVSKEEKQSLRERLSRAIKKELNIDYDSSKHAYLVHPVFDRTEGLIFDIFEKID